MAGSTIWTIKKLLLWTTHYFQEHHLDSPRLDAELLLAHVLHKQRIYLYTDFDLIVEPSELSLYREYIKKRVSGVSTAAIIGEKEFMGLTFKVNEDVLIPRPDTETWLEKVIQYHRNEQGLYVADLGTGSGAILLSFLYYCKEDTGVGVDISEKALAVAEENGKNLKMDDRVTWRRGDYLTALEEGELFDGILTNPPYIPTGDIRGLAEEVRHEPMNALDGGADGLTFYRKLAEGAAEHLKDGGFLAAEFGIHQAADVVNLLKETGKFDSFEVITDYGGIERAVYCRKKAEP
ncbi:peptide chain release factor N(5)-glutamine methyltransferase [Dialister succinatiphilus]|uniref:peptide chain release factor N(5)-glutamine methyltransferase n=1 Tax=Dialister succinatiphilus TaxID=487173 RepID=UPI0023525DA9|nr:peptide chain release factor N(5)-glutamine methyltransferase [Dialister succinatiphilus]MCI6030436.1 peptide chain release factor N(5)-glutamine methyltransferase [Dialister succinatiphilus]